LFKSSRTQPGGLKSGQREKTEISLAYKKRQGGQQLNCCPRLCGVQQKESGWGGGGGKCITEGGGGFATHMVLVGPGPQNPKKVKKREAMRRAISQACKTPRFRESRRTREGRGVYHTAAQMLEQGRRGKKTSLRKLKRTCRAVGKGRGAGGTVLHTPSGEKTRGGTRGGGGKRVQ